MQQVSPDILNSTQTLLLIDVPSSDYSWSPPPQKKGSYNLQRIIMINLTIIPASGSPRHCRRTRTSATRSLPTLCQESTLVQVRDSRSMSLALDKQVILTPYRFSCCSKVFPCDKYDSQLDTSPSLFTCLLVCLDATTRKPTTRTNMQIV